MLETRQKTLRPVIADAADPVDFAGFTRYLYRRRNFMIVASTVAVALAGIGSFFMTARYTATASILIEPPAGNDPRGAMAISTVYLESLKSYEHFASSDSLFRQALTQLGLRDVYSGVSIEGLKRQVLKVKKPKDEKILEISATLPDRTKAQKLAQYIAEQTIAMNRSLERDSINDIGRGAADLVQATQSRLEEARTAKQAFLDKQPTSPLEADLAGTTDLKTRADRNLADAEVELAATLARLAAQPGDKSSNAMVTKDDVAAIQAQVSALRQQSHTLGQHMAEISALLEKRRQQREILDKELQAAQARYEAAVTRKTDVLSSEAFRGERLEIIDPGVVPERPSSPNIPLNLVVAFLASVFCCVVYLAFRFAYARSEPVYR
jgi:uncharacterized protein involved in exopolysaccharide biosynthesis